MIWIGIGASVALLIAFFWAVRTARPPEPAAAPKKAPAPSASTDEDDVEITLVRAMPVDLPKKAKVEPAPAVAEAVDATPAEEEDEEEGGADQPRQSTTTPFYPDDEPEAAIDEPTQPATRFLVSACGQTDRGLARRRNEDSFLMAEEKGLFVVADGMGGYAGGKVASELAVATIRDVFDAHAFTELDPSVPRRGAEIAWGVQKANAAVHAKAQSEPELAQMGTTVVAARFSPDKQRAYLAHVGDSRAYRFRGGKLRRLTTDHTMRQLGFSGRGAEHLYRAVGIAPNVDVDLIIDKPRPEDVYLLCSDGLTKMATDDDIATILDENLDDPEAAAYSLIEIANDHGGKDNVTCIVVKVVERLPTLQKAPTENVDV